MQAVYLAEWNALIQYHNLPGAEPAFVFLHGLGGASAPSFMQTVANPDFAGRRALLIDSLGAGFSDKPTAFSYSLEDHAASVAQVLDHENLNNCTLVGHSHGGSIGIVLATHRPDLVGRLVVMEGNLDPGGHPTGSRRIAAYSQATYLDEGYDTILNECLDQAKNGDQVGSVAYGMNRLAAPYAVYRGAVSLVEERQLSLRDLFYQLSIPRVFVYGEANVPDSPETALPDAPLPEPLREQGIAIQVVPDAGHMMMWDNPAGFVQMLKAALL